jgi:phage terminase small subunit
VAETPAKLTPKQEQFVSAYVGEARYNATKAAMLAGYSEATAYSQGHRLLKNVEIAARIKDILATRSMTAEAVLDELTDVAGADWREFITVRTNPRTGAQIDVRMDLASKVKALEVLAKAHGLLTDRIDISGQVTQTVQLVGISEGDV